MKALLIVPGVLLISLTLWDAFETMILPRRVARRLTLTRWFYKSTWFAFGGMAGRVRRVGHRENILGLYGPLSLILLFTVWGALLILGFALAYRSTGFTNAGDGHAATLGTVLYFSGTSFFTLGLGDVSPSGPFGRGMAVLESGIGFGFLALVIGYLPVFYQAFSRREVHISLLDARAGSPPTAVGIFRRYNLAARHADLDLFMASWERWAAELLESHLSYPQLAYFRSQHDRQSWLAALCVILDANAVIIALSPDPVGRPPQLAFAMARHAAVDLGQIFGRRELQDTRDRLPPEAMGHLRRALGSAWPEGPAGDAAECTLNELRASYEPYVGRISERLMMDLPPWFPDPTVSDDWETGLTLSNGH